MSNIYHTPASTYVLAPPPPGAVEVYCWGCRAFVPRIIWASSDTDDLCPACYATTYPERVVWAEPMPRPRVLPLVAGLIAAAAWAWRRW